LFDFLSFYEYGAPAAELPITAAPASRFPLRRFTRSLANFPGAPQLPWPFFLARLQIA